MIRGVLAEGHGSWSVYGDLAGKKAQLHQVSWESDLRQHHRPWMHGRDPISQRYFIGKALDLAGVLMASQKRNHWRKDIKLTTRVVNPPQGGGEVVRIRSQICWYRSVTSGPLARHNMAAFEHLRTSIFGAGATGDAN